MTKTPDVWEVRPHRLIARWQAGPASCEPGHHLTPSLCPCRWYYTEAEAQAVVDAHNEALAQGTLW